MGIYEKIQELCKEHGISIRKLERELGFGNSTIAKWKTSEPAFASIRAVAEYFNVSIGYLIGQKNEKNSNKSDKSIIEKIDLFSGVGGLRNALTPTSMCIQFVDEPEIHMHSKTAYELVKEIAKMKDTDVSLLLDMAKRLNPTENVIPFPQYPTVTNKDIDEFAARNAKKKFTREEIAEMLHEMKQEDE